MKNKEKFAKEIVEIAVNGFEIAFDKKGNLTTCHSIKCTDCSFFGKHGSCYDRLKNWAESEYVEPKEFTEEEKTVFRVCKNLEYAARDYNGIVWGYFCKPNKTRDCWSCVGFIDNAINLSKLTGLEFKSILWEDSEPTSREEILR